MTYKAYIQAQNNFPIADWAVSAYLGFREKQTDIVFFEDIKDVPTSSWNIVVAEIIPTNHYLQRLGIEPKRALNIPDELMKYTGRKIDYMTMGEFKMDTRLPVFVKPNRYSKEFVAGVISEPQSRSFFFNNVEDDCPVLVSEVVDFVSEYRCYVINGVLKGIKHYLGDIRIFPDVKVIDAAIADYKIAPVGYAIDFGVTSDGRTLLVECNDGWSLGNYGLDNLVYTNLLCRRWVELLKNRK
jgi:hypothetical protein